MKDIDQYHVPYRIIYINPENEDYYNGIFESDDAWYSIDSQSNGYNQYEGAIDYFRHPGILLDMSQNYRWMPYTLYFNPHTGVHATGSILPVDDSDSDYWNNHQWKRLSPVSANDGNSEHYIASEIDSLFTENLDRIYVFGERVTDNYGYTIHDVHQNQGDRSNSGHTSGDGIFQDGAVIFEYTNGTKKLLMVKFGDHDYDFDYVPGQIDFSYDTGNTPGIAAPFTTLTLYYNPSIAGDHATFGPYSAYEIEAITEGELEVSNSNITDVSISLNITNVKTDPIYSNDKIIEANHPETSVEYVRSSRYLWQLFSSYPHSLSPGAKQYYIHIKRESGPTDTTIPIHVRYR